MQGCGIVAILCSFGAFFAGFCGMNYRVWRMSIAAFFLCGLFLWLSAFLIPRGLDLSDLESRNHAVTGLVLVHVIPSLTVVKGCISPIVKDAEVRGVYLVCDRVGVRHLGNS